MLRSRGSRAGAGGIGYASHLLARPRLRPARSRGGMVGLGAASVGWRPRSCGTGILLKVRAIPSRANEHAAFGFFIGACIFKQCKNVVILVSSVPPIESLKSKTTLKNLTNPLRVLLFKDSVKPRLRRGGYCMTPVVMQYPG
jgi:hypothetical protein